MGGEKNVEKNNSSHFDTSDVSDDITRCGTGFAKSDSQSSIQNIYTENIIKR